MFTNWSHYIIEIKHHEHISCSVLDLDGGFWPWELEHGGEFVRRTYWKPFIWNSDNIGKTSLRQLDVESSGFLGRTTFNHRLIGPDDSSSRADFTPQERPQQQITNKYERNINKHIKDQSAQTIDLFVFYFCCACGPRVVCMRSAKN